MSFIPAPLSGLKKAFASLALVSVAAFALASMGGGGNKSKEKTSKPEFTPIRTANGFTLKAGPIYRGSVIFAQEKSRTLVAYNSLATYQKGNTTYILPVRYKIQTASSLQGSNLQLLNLRVRIHK